MSEGEEMEKIWQGSNVWTEQDILIRSIYLFTNYAMESREVHRQYYQELIETEQDPEEKADFEACMEEQGEDEMYDAGTSEHLIWILEKRGHITREQATRPDPDIILELLEGVDLPKDSVREALVATTIQKLYLMRRLVSLCKDIIKESPDPTFSRDYPPDLSSLCGMVIWWTRRRFNGHIPHNKRFSQNASSPLDFFPEMEPLYYGSLLDMAKWDLIDNPSSPRV